MTPFLIATNNINYFDLNLAKLMKDPYDINIKSLNKEIEEDIRKWEDFPCSWISRINSKNWHLVSSPDLLVWCRHNQPGVDQTLFRPEPEEDTEGASLLTSGSQDGGTVN